MPFLTQKKNFVQKVGLVSESILEEIKTAIRAVTNAN